MSGIMNIGLRSLIAYETALTVNSQNISNVNTPFYSRRIATFSEANAYGGVEVKDVKRVFDQASADNMAKDSSNFNSSAVLLQGCQELETLLGGDTNSVPAYIANAITALRSLSDQPADLNQRGMYINQLNTVASRFNDIYSQLRTQKDDANKSIETIGSTINTLVGQVAHINEQLIDANAKHQDTSSLLDQQESLLNDLSQYTDYSIDRNEYGEVNISIGNGVPILVGSKNFDVSAKNNKADASNIDIVVGSGSDQVIVTNEIKGGQLKGIIQFRDGTLKKAMDYLNRIALVIGDKLNRQNKLGIDLNGNLGGNIFNDINDTKATYDRVIVNNNNTGTLDMSVNIDDSSSLTASDYDLQFDTATHYNLVRKSDGETVSTGNITAIPQTITIDGFSVNINGGTIVAGDKFIISPTRYASENFKVTMTDSSLMAFGWPIDAEDDAANQGTGNISVGSIVDTTNPAFSIPKQLNPPLIIRFITSTSYEILNANDNSVIESPIAYDPTQGSKVFPTAGSYDPGYRISLSGDMVAGDSFTVKYNSNGSSNPAGDNRNVAAIEDLFDTGMIENNSMTFVQAYRFLSTNVSVDTSKASNENKSDSILMQQSQEAYSQISGVSLHEEIVDMMNFQEAYQASSQIINTAKNVFESILGLMGR